MDVNNNSVEGHESLQKQLESLIQQDKQDDVILRNSLNNQKESLQERINHLEKEYKEQTLLEKKFIEKQNIRDQHNLQQIDKRSTYTKFK